MNSGSPINRDGRSGDHPITMKGGYMHFILDILGTILFLAIFFSFKERQWPHIKDVVKKNDIREINRKK